MKSISVIVPSYNSWQTLDRTLRSLESQSRRDLILETLVVDSSTDIRMETLRRRWESRGVRWIRAGVRVMPAATRNFGARQAKGDLLVFLDSDAYMANDWIEKIYRHYEQGRKAGGGSIAVPEFQRRKPLALAQYFLQFNEYMDAGELRIKEFLPSCNIYCDRGLFEECGGFPEIRAAEDVLFFKKVSRKTPVWFIPEAKVFHIFRENWTSFFGNQQILGKYILIYRQMLMSDRFYYRSLWPVALLPAFNAIKLLRITLRVLRSGPAAFFRYAMVFPVFLVGLFFWNVGFARGALR